MRILPVNNYQTQKQTQIQNQNQRKQNTNFGIISIQKLNDNTLLTGFVNELVEESSKLLSIDIESIRDMIKPDKNITLGDFIKRLIKIFYPVATVISDEEGARNAYFAFTKTETEDLAGAILTFYNEKLLKWGLKIPYDRDPKIMAPGISKAGELDLDKIFEIISFIAKKENSIDLKNEKLNTNIISPN